MREKYNIVLSVAGSDSSAGAGVQADLKSVMACGAYCTMAITALTAQNTCGVQSVNIVSDDVVSAQIGAITDDMKIDALKLGMLPTRGIVERVRRLIVDNNISNVILDPVMVATSGDLLVGGDVAKEIISSLLPLATVITPNIPECEFISGIKINGEEDFAQVAEYFKGLGSRALLLKSGHLDGDMIKDHLYNFENGDHIVYEYVKIETKNTHGTGCSLSSSIAAYMAQGHGINDAVKLAEDYIHTAIASATYKLGNGCGPVNHFYMLDK